MSDAPAARDLLGADMPTNRGAWGPHVNGTGAPVDPVVIR